MSNSGDVCGCYICASDIDNWPSGISDADQLELIQKTEEIIDKLTDEKWCGEAFDLKLNGNDKNRLFIPVPYDIRTVGHVYVNCVELDAGWYTWDENSIYLTPCTSGSGILSPEIMYLLGEMLEAGIFPRGYNNIRVIGTYGEGSIPKPIKQAAIMYIKWHNDPTLYTFSSLKKSESIGDYSYTNLTGTAGDVLTGIMEVDLILNQYIKGKGIFMCP